jgi:hypothetical protein
VRVGVFMGGVSVCCMAMSRNIPIVMVIFVGFFLI